MNGRFYDIINYRIVGDENFIISPLNVVLFIAIYLIAKIALKYLKRYFKIKNLTERELTIEGKKIAIWKLTRQITFVVVILLCILSLRINNPDVNFSMVLSYEFVRIDKFHIAVYHLFLIVIVITLTRLAVSLARVYIHRSTGKSDSIDPGTRFVYLQLAKYVIYSFAILFVFRSFGADVNLFIGIFTVVGVGFALGAQGLLRDYMSGILLLFERSIKVGDVIEIETPGHIDNFICTVEKINLRTSQIKTTFDKVLVIPNSKLTHESVINWSLGERITRFSISVRVAYGSDTELVQKILIQCARNHPKTVQHLDYVVWLRKFGSDGLELELLFYAEQSFFIDQYKSDIRFQIDHEFRKTGIKIPLTQREVRDYRANPNDTLNSGNTPVAN